MESQSYFKSGCRAVQFHPVVIAISPLNARAQIDAKNIRMSLAKCRAFSK